MAERQLWPHFQHAALGVVLLAALALPTRAGLAQIGSSMGSKINYPPISIAGPSGSIELGKDATITVRIAEPYLLPVPVSFQVEMGQQFIKNTIGNVKIAPGSTSAQITLTTTGNTGSAGQSTVYVTARDPSMPSPVGVRFAVRNPPPPLPAPPPVPVPVPVPAPAIPPPSNPNSTTGGDIISSNHIDPHVGPVTRRNAPTGTGTAATDLKPELDHRPPAGDSTDVPKTCQVNLRGPNCDIPASTGDDDWTSFLLKLAALAAAVVTLWIDYLVLVRTRWHFVGLSAQGAAIRMGAFEAPAVLPEVTATARPAQLVAPPQITELSDQQESSDGLDI